jgi:tryptophanase
MKIPYAEPYKIKMVESIRPSSEDERKIWIRDAKYNLFNLHSEEVFIDLLTDSGTGAMSDLQWAALMSGDESYAGSKSFYKLKEVIKKLTGFEFVLPTHQGRAAENVLFSAVVMENDIVPGNAHFDTTKGHIEFRKARAVDCTIDKAFDTKLIDPFKGNIDLDKLESVLKNNPKENIPMIIVTLTCNTTGGQPVSIRNMSDVYKLAQKYGTKVIFDSARFAENAYFIKTREKGYENKTIKEIVFEMYRYADGMTMSSKKDGIVNIGGFLAFKESEWYEKSTTFNIMFEGYLTYGGMAGRDMNALAQGLQESTEFNYLESRINQVEYLGSQLTELGIPVLQPFGGHAIFINATEFLPNVPREEFPAQTLVVELFLEAGVRSAEIGAIMADRDPISRENRYPELEMLRLAIPRRVYTNNHMDVVVAAIKNIYDRRDSIKKGLKIIKEADILRHFTVELDRVL